MLGALLLGCLSVGQVADVAPTEPPSWKLLVRGQTVDVMPTAVVAVTAEPKALPADPPAWCRGAMLDSCRVTPPTYYHCCHSILIPGSVEVREAPDGGTIYERGRDYEVDEMWAAVSRLPDGRIAEGQTVYVDYRLGLQRMDRVCLPPGGSPTVIAGAGVRNGPAPQPCPDGWQTLAFVWVKASAVAVTADCILVPDPAGAERFAAKWRASETQAGPRFVEKTLAKLRAGEDVTIVCLGDSVTCGADLPSIEGDGYVARLGRELGTRFPQAHVRVFNAGVGGTPSAFGIERLDRDVLVHKPDLVTVMFPLNDCGTPKEQFAENLRIITRRCREAGAEVIHMTSNFMTESWFGRLAEVNETVREGARELDCGLCDSYRRWELLAYEGIPYETLLLNTINHPDARGHDFFVQELLRFFPAGENR